MKYLSVGCLFVKIVDVWQRKLMKPQFVQYDDINYVAKITEKFALIYSYFADDATPRCALVADISDIFPPAPLASPE